MNGQTHPLTGCADNCCSRHGGMQCERCGLWFCTRELNDEGLCDECEADIIKETED